MQYHIPKGSASFSFIPIPILLIKALSGNFTERVQASTSCVHTSVKRIAEVQKADFSSRHLRHPSWWEAEVGEVERRTIYCMELLCSFHFGKAWIWQKESWKRKTRSMTVFTIELGTLVKRKKLNPVIKKRKLNNDRCTLEIQNYRWKQTRAQNNWYSCCVMDFFVHLNSYAFLRIGTWVLNEIFIFLMRHTKVNNNVSAATAQPMYLYRLKNVCYHVIN